MCTHCLTFSRHDINKATVPPHTSHVTQVKCDSSNSLCYYQQAPQGVSWKSKHGSAAPERTAGVSVWYCLKTGTTGEFKATSQWREEVWLWGRWSRSIGPRPKIWTLGSGWERRLWGVLLTSYWTSTQTQIRIRASTATTCVSMHAKQI